MKKAKLKAEVNFGGTVEIFLEYLGEMSVNVTKI